MPAFGQQQEDEQSFLKPAVHSNINPRNSIQHMNNTSSGTGQE